MALTRSDPDQHPLSSLCEAQRKLIQVAKKQKKERFGDYADEAYRFYNGAHNFMWDEEYSKNRTDGYLDEQAATPFPQFRMTVNKVSDAVDLFVPSMMQQYPQVLVKPVPLPDFPPESLGMNPADPVAMENYALIQQQRMSVESIKESVAGVKQHYLNWLQLETSKLVHARRGITEAVVKGLGVTYTELHSPRGGEISYPRSVQISCDQLIKDPDATQREDVQWIAIEWTQPRNLVERKFGLPPGALKGSLQSKQAQATTQGRNDQRSNRGRDATSYDLITYWEVFSKNGFGGRLKNLSDVKKEVRQYVEGWGDFTYGVFADNVPYPLNVPTDAIVTESDEQIFERAQWPIPFWSDDGTDDWPVSELYFKDDPNDVWPIGIFKPVIGELRFVNWCMSFLADKVAKDSVDYIGVLKAAAEEIQEQLRTKTGPHKLIEVDSVFGDNINKVISFLNKPTFSSDIWKMVAEVMHEIDKRTGLNELMYGMSSRQMRSATEADIMGGNATIRPDAWAKSADDWYSLMAKKECQAAVWMLERSDYERVMGPIGASIFETYVQGEDFDNVARDYGYTLASGTARKPNKNQRLRSLNELGQVALPVFTELIGLGIVAPFNAYMEDYAEAIDLDPTRYLVQLPEPEPDSGPDPEEVELHAKIQELELQLAEHAQKLRMNEEEHDQGLKHDREKHRQDMRISRQQPMVNGNGR